MTNNVGFTLIFICTKLEFVLKEWVSPQGTFLILVQIVELRRNAKGRKLVA
jgi:hypothetical protein